MKASRFRLPLKIGEFDGWKILNGNKAGLFEGSFSWGGGGEI